jgi:nucleotide-binding universal stress UspA family protein
VAESIVRVAECGEENEATGEGAGYDSIALTTHGVGGLQRWSLGHTVEHVLHTTRLPILLVRPAKRLHKAPRQRAALAHSGSR